MKYTVKRSLGVKKIEEGQELIVQFKNFDEVTTNEGTAVVGDFINLETKQPERYFIPEVLGSLLEGLEGNYFFIKNAGKREGKKYFDFEVLEIEVEKEK